MRRGSPGRTGQARDGASDPQFLLLAQTLALTNTIQIDTTDRSPDEIAAEMLAVIIAS